MALHTLSHVMYPKIYAFMDSEVWTDKLHRPQPYSLTWTLDTDIDTNTDTNTPFDPRFVYYLTCKK